MTVTSQSGSVRLVSFWEFSLRLSEICVQRPVFAFMLIMFLVVLGVFSFVDLGVDLFPRTDPATVNVRVRLPGASPEEVTSQVILPLEESIAAVSGIDEMRAMVTEGSGNIIVTFVLEREHRRGGRGCSRKGLAGDAQAAAERAASHRREGRSRTATRSSRWPSAATGRSAS